MGEQVTIETAFCMHKGKHPTSNYEEEDWVGQEAWNPQLSSWPQRNTTLP